MSLIKRFYIFITVDLESLSKLYVLRIDKFANIIAFNFSQIWELKKKKYVLWYGIQLKYLYLLRGVIYIVLLSP